MGDGKGNNPVLVVSPEGVARAQASLPLADAEFQALHTRVSSKEKGVEIREKFGRLLYEGIFRGEVLAAWAKTSMHPDGVRLRLIVDAPEVATLPWELLHDGLNFLATDACLAISHYIPVPEPRGLPVVDKLRVLLVSASPAPLPPILPVEVDTLADAIRAVGPTVEVTVVRSATGQRLADAIAGVDYHVVHYLGHGASGNLLLEGKTPDEVVPLPDRTFGQMLFGRTSVRLVVLSACNSAQSQGNVFAGVGPALIRTRVPAVVAMRYEFVQLSTAQTFNRSFYAEVAKGTLVDAAVNRARNTISSTGDLLAQRDWSTPVLYLGTRSGRLLTLQSEQATEVEKAAQSLQATAMKDAAAATAWGQLQETFEDLYARQRQLAALVRLHDLVQQMHSEFQEIVRRAASGIAGAEYNQIKKAWGKMQDMGVLAKLQSETEKLTDASLKGKLELLTVHADVISGAMMNMNLGHLNAEINKMRQALGRLEAELGSDVSSTVDDLLGVAERTLGRLTA